tara:strand:- start:6069 stop:7367 length:1299 start_codon:yes stop_codon:yes gene_type:complete
MEKDLKNLNITIIGLGYVGLPLAVEFSRQFNVTGFDIDQTRIDELKNKFDRTNEVSSHLLKNVDKLILSSSIDDIVQSNVYIVTVPTPVDKNNHPDFNPLLQASKMIASLLDKGNIVIYESTVYPGATEEICVPILEKISNLKYNVEFFCGYSPERINPGDKKYKLTNIKKLTSGSNKEASQFVDKLYQSIISAGTFNVSSIAVAEAAKVIENTQRDVNIALSNELAIIFNKLGIDTAEVLEAAGTKWNFLPFRPGLVGGHCIGVDPYYLTHKAVEVGYHPEMILAGRRINDNMGQYIAENTIIELAKNGINAIGSKVAIMGLTFKENCPDLRNTKIVSIKEYLDEYNCLVDVVDPYADVTEAKELFGIDLINIDLINGYDAIILSVQHDKYLKIKKSKWLKMIKSNGILVDVKSIYPIDMFLNEDITHWRL